MQIPISVTARHVDLPASAEKMIRERAKKLEKYYNRLVGCDVVVEGPGQHHRTGGPYTVRIELRVPGNDLTVNQKQSEDMTSAIRDAFNAAKRQLEEFSRLRRGEIKHHVEPPQGRVVKLFRDEQYGFLETLDGREVYFHRNSVLDPGFEQLEIGSEVRFAEEQGDEGPQASTVSIVKS